MKTILTKTIERKRINKGSHPGYGMIKLEDAALFPYIGKDSTIKITVNEFELQPVENNS